MTAPIITEAIKRDVGQHFVFGFHGFEVSQNIKTLIQDYYIGNVILMKRNIQSAGQTRKLVQDLQLLAKEAGHERPLLIGIDQENGAVFPGAMALAATGSPDDAKKVSTASAIELKMVGINWVYAPVADINTDSRNPVIGVRSFGDDPNKVATFAVAVSRGSSSAGVAPTGKHFPGHGDTHVDSHLALPRILKSKDQILREELVPFKSLIASGIPSIMTGHMALPLITGDDTPCSLSRKITTDLLKDEMGFKGVVVTDCLEMDAIAEPEQGGCGIQEGAFRALKAGADIVMICHTFERHIEAVEGIYRALEQGQISVDELRDSGERIARMKKNFAGQWSNISLEVEPAWDAIFAKVHATNLQLSQEVYLRSTTIVWNGGSVIPLNADYFKPDKRLLLLTPKMENVNRAVDPGDGTLIGPGGVVRNTAGASYLALARAVKKRTKLDHVVFSADGAILADILNGVGGLIFVMRNADLKRWQLEYLERLRLRIKEMQLDSIPVILLSSCGPYDLRGAAEKKTYEDWTGYMATYEFTAEAFEAAVRVMFGEEKGLGVMPVDLI
ncbi:glycoside hydrolase superfamily [Flammula alnicola]|nr:glycoside hydrolase superfamily [Flammula alnicola]